MPEASPEASPATNTHAVRSLAAWLLERETDYADDPDALLAGAERTCQKLCARVAKLVTAAGCQALLARAIHLAAAEAPFLKDVRAGAIPGPCLEHVRASAQGQPCRQTEAGLLAMIAHLIGLLVLFIGENLTGRLVRDVWPDAPLSTGGTDPTSQEAQS